MCPFSACNPTVGLRCFYSLVVRDVVGPFPRSVLTEFYIGGHAARPLGRAASDYRKICMLDEPRVLKYI